MIRYEKAMVLAKNSIKVHEGLRLHPYDDKTGYKDAGDAGGKITIGWGRNLETNGITLHEAEVMLAADLKNSLHEAIGMFGCFDLLCSQRQAVLIEMIFNMGSYRVSKFKKMRAALNEDVIDYNKVANEMLDSKWHRDFVELIKRKGRKEEDTRSYRLAQAMREGVVINPWWQ